LNISSLNKDAVQELSKEIEKAVQDVADKHGLVIKMGSGSYTQNNATLKVEIAVKSLDGTVATKEASSFKALCTFYGLQESDLGRTFTSRGSLYVITGLASKSRTNPILATRQTDNKLFKFPVDSVKKALGINVPESVKDPNAEENDFKFYARMYGLVPEDYGKEFSYVGETYKLVKILPKGKKYPLDIEKVGGRNSGKHFKFTIEQFNACLGRDSKSAGSTTKGVFEIGSGDIAILKLGGLDD
jgi:hypothetical protein